MDYTKTNLAFLPKELIKEYGSDRGNILYRRACEIYTELCEKEKKYENDAMNKHVFERILPAIALYKTFLETNNEKEKSVYLVLNETQKNATRMRKENQKLGKMPFAYRLFKTFAKSHMDKNYPKDGWDLEWVKRDKYETHFNMKSCIYYDMCIKYECPELCTVFCQNDITAFKGYLPKIVFKREGTIGEGKQMCDFHFINGKKEKRGRNE